MQKDAFFTILFGFNKFKWYLCSRVKKMRTFDLKRIT